MRSTLLVSALLASVSALAAPPSLASVLDADAYTIGAGRTPLPPADVYEIARLARAINTAYCLPFSEPASQLPLGRSVLLASSRDMNVAGTPEMSWYISHTPSTGVLSLSFAAPPQSRDDSGAEDTMLYPSVLPLPTYMFNSMPTGARVHTTFLPALETHGAAALRAVRDVPAANIEVSGHGRGAAIALLVAAALRRRLDVPITATLFGLPRVGNAAFARWVDELGPEGGHAPFVLRRVNSRNEVAVPGLVHPRAIAEVVMGTDGAARCVPTVEEEESAVCAAGETSLGGPYGSVRIHRECA